MLEILFLVYLCKEIGRMVEKRKRKGAGWYKAMLVAMWLIGEMLGGACGVVVVGRGFGMYVFALMGAAAGATGAFLIVYSLSSPDAGPRGFEVQGVHDSDLSI